MSELGFVTQKDSQFVAKINTKDLGKQYRFTGPPRGEDEQQAYQDLYYIRAAAEGVPTRVHLQAPGQRGGSKVLIRLSENVR